MFKTFKKIIFSNYFLRFIYKMSYFKILSHKLQFIRDPFQVVELFENYNNKKNYLLKISN